MHMKSILQLLVVSCVLLCACGCSGRNDDSYKAPPPSANARPADTVPVGASTEGPKQMLPGTQSQGSAVKPL
jgi:hypothetical protein